MSIETPGKRTFVGKEGNTLVGDAFGPDDGAPVLLLHGGGQTRFAWTETARALGKHGFSVLALDLRGHGESDWSPSGDYALTSFASDVHVVAASFAKKPIVVGASLGGLSALVAEAEYHHGSALVLVDIAPTMEPEGVTRIVSFMKARPEGFASLEEAADVIAEYLPHRARPKDLSGLAKNLRRSENGRLRWHWDPRFLQGPRVPQASTTVEFLRAVSKNVTVPALLVRGKRSDLLSQRGVDEFLALVPHARFVDVADAGHMVVGDENDAFTAAVLGFLNDVAA